MLFELNVAAFSLTVAVRRCWARFRCAFKLVNMGDVVVFMLLAVAVNALAASTTAPFNLVTS